MYGIHRCTIYEWRKSIEEQKKGPKGRVSWQTPVQLERIVVRLRKQTNYGPKRLRVELEIYDITLFLTQEEILGALSAINSQQLISTQRFDSYGFTKNSRMQIP